MTRRHDSEGRGVAQLVADFGHHLAPLQPAPAPVKDSDPFTFMVGKHGSTGRASGWAPVPAPLAVYRMTSEQVGGVWPLIAGDGLPPTGAQLGIDFLQLIVELHDFGIGISKLGGKLRDLNLEIGLLLPHFFHER